MPKPKRRGNCYVTTEALWHCLGARRSGWRVMRMRIPGDTHWFLQHDLGIILDPTRRQFTRSTTPDYMYARQAAFLTKKPSRRARVLMKEMTWQ